MITKYYTLFKMELKGFEFGKTYNKWQAQQLSRYRSNTWITAVPATH